MMLASADHSDFSLEQLLAAKRETVTVCIPTRETAQTIAATVEAVAALREAGLVDQLLVVDADSTDGTGAIAQAAGAEVLSESALLPQFGPVRGKGDAMWRALSVVSGEIVLYLDGDIHDMGGHYAIGPLGPLLCNRNIDFVKGFYRRPLALSGVEIEDGGGRVTELTAKPLLELVAPELATFRQPLAGECAARRSLLMGIPFCTGYGVETGMLIEAWKQVGLERMAQVSLGSKRNSHQPLGELAKMAREVVAAVVAQAQPGQVGDLGSIQPAAGWKPQLEIRPPMREVFERGVGTAGGTSPAFNH